RGHRHQSDDAELHEAGQHLPRDEDEHERNENGDDVHYLPPFPCRSRISRLFDWLAEMARKAAPIATKLPPRALLPPMMKASAHTMNAIPASWSIRGWGITIPPDSRGSR